MQGFQRCGLQVQIYKVGAHLQAFGAAVLMVLTLESGNNQVGSFFVSIEVCCAPLAPLFCSLFLLYEMHHRQQGNN